MTEDIKLNLINHKDARILWNENYVNKKKYITDFLVTEFIVTESDEGPQYLYNKYHLDIGNCLADYIWITYTPGVLNLIFFGEFDYHDLDHRNRVFRELMKIKEYNEEITDNRKVSLDF